MRRLLFSLVILAMGVFSLRAEELVVWMPSQPVFSAWEKVSTHAFPFLGGRIDSLASTWEFAVCSEDGKHQECASFPWKEQPSVGWVSDRSLAAWDSLGEGTFFAAVLINGTRVSNVTRIVIGPVPPVLPVLSVIVLGMGRGDVDCLGGWISPPPGGDPELTNMACGYPEIFIGGEWRKNSFQAWAARVAALLPDRITPQIWNLRRYDGPAGFHFLDFLGTDIRVRAAGYVSAPLKLEPPDPRMAEVFDSAFGLR